MCIGQLSLPLIKSEDSFHSILTIQEQPAYFIFLQKPCQLNRLNIIFWPPVACWAMCILLWPMHISWLSVHPFLIIWRLMHQSRGKKDFSKLFLSGGCCGSTSKKTVVGGWAWAWWLVTDVQRLSLEVNIIIIIFALGGLLVFHLAKSFWH